MFVKIEGSKFGRLINLNMCFQLYITRAEGGYVIKAEYLDFGQNERVLGQKTRERENAKTGQRKELDTVSFSTMADWINNTIFSLE